MADAAPTDRGTSSRFTAERYFGLVAEGLLAEDDRVELLEGVVVAMSPRNARHDAAVTRAHTALRAALGADAVIRVQCALSLGRHSVPEPDVAIVPGDVGRYDTAHPTTALLVVEVADSSLPQDRLTKARMYAAAGILEYWIVNLRDDRVEVLREPNPPTAAYASVTLARRGDRLSVVSSPEAAVDVDDLLPRP